MRKLLSLMLIAAVSIISSTAQIVTSTSITHTFQRVEEPPKPKAWNHSGIFIGGNWASIPSYELNGLELPGVSTYGFELGYRLLLGNTKIGGFSWNIFKLQFSSNYDDTPSNYDNTRLFSLTTGLRYDSPRILGGISLYGSFDFGLGLFHRPEIEDERGSLLRMVIPDRFPKLTEIAVGVKLSRHFSIGVSMQSQAVEIHYYNTNLLYENATLFVPTVKFEYLF